MKIIFTYTDENEAFEQYKKLRTHFNAELIINDEKKIVVVKNIKAISEGRNIFIRSSEEESWGLPDISFEA